jgi:hypothetical protein
MLLVSGPIAGRFGGVHRPAPADLVVEAGARVHEVHDLPRLPAADVDQRVMDIVDALSVAGTVGG